MYDNQLFLILLVIVAFIFLILIILQILLEIPTHYNIETTRGICKFTCKNQSKTWNLLNVIPEIIEILYNPEKFTKTEVLAFIQDDITCSICAEITEILHKQNLYSPLIIEEVKTHLQDAFICCQFKEKVTTLLTDYK